MIQGFCINLACNYLRTAMKNIIAAIDFSSISEKVLDAAAAQARVFSAKLWLIHAAAPDPDFVGYDTGPQHVRDFVAKGLQGEHAKLQELADKLRAEGLDASALSVQGPTVETILAEADKLDADSDSPGFAGARCCSSPFAGEVSARECFAKQIARCLF